jgi:hypothetical protein
LGKHDVLAFLTRAAVPQSTRPLSGPDGFNPRHTRTPRSRPGCNLTLTTDKNSSVATNIQFPFTAHPSPDILFKRESDTPTNSVPDSLPPVRLYCPLDTPLSF